MSIAQRRLVIVLGLLSFGAVYSNVVMVPMLAAVAHEFGVTTGTAGLAVATYGLPGIVSGFILGPLSDRIGRRPFVFWGSILLGSSTFLGALAPDFGLLLAARAFAGLGASVIFTNVHATVGDTFPYRERGAAISTVIALNTMGGLIGLPLSGIVTDLTSWRVALALAGVVVIVAACVLFRYLPAFPPRGAHVSARVLYRSIYTSPSALAAVLSSFLGGLYWQTWTTYLVVFLQVTYVLSAGVASTVALASTAGIVIGSALGGRFGDRLGQRLVVIRSLAVSGLAIAVVGGVQFPLLVAAAFLFVSAITNGMRGTANVTLLTEQAPHARGTIIAINIALNNGALTLGAVVGGRLVDTVGFAALGVACGVVALLSIASVLRVRETPLTAEPA